MIFRDTRIVSTSLIVLILGLSACAAPQRSSDYREQHSIVVTQETVALTLATGSVGGMFSGQAKTDLDYFTAAYHARAAGPIAISLQSGAGEGERLARLHKVRDALIRAGVAEADIVVVPTGSGAPDNEGAVLSFRANAIKVPECEDWTSNPSYNWSNRSHANYGCSVQRNLGLTIADPGDLKRAKPLSGLDANRAAGAIGALQGAAAGGGGEAGAAAGDAAAAGAAAGQ